MNLIKSRHLHDDGSPRYFFGCTRYPECKGTHGADKRGIPLGVPGSKETNDARHKVHQQFNTFYLRKKMSRSKAYGWLAERLKVDRKKCGFAYFDLETCNRIVNIIQRAEERARKAGA